MNASGRPHTQEPALPGALPVVLAAGAISFVLALVPSVILIALGLDRGRAAWDSIVYHERFIRQLADDWPVFDLSNPLTATTPGYHIILATFAYTGAEPTWALRLVSAVIGACFIALASAWFAGRLGVLAGILLSLPLIASSYVLGASAWLLPDNLAWLGVLAILYCATRPCPSWRPILAGSLILIGLVFTRQIHIWSASALWIAAWLSTAQHSDRLFDQLPARLRRAIIAVLLTLPAFVLLAWFIKHWGGTTAPRFQGNITGINPATPAFILVQITILMLGFGPWLVPAFVRALRDDRALLLAAAVLGLVLSAAPITTLSPPDGRYSGWWMLAGRAPVLFGRTSVAFLVLAPIGAMLLAASLRATPHGVRWVLLASLIAFAAAMSATINSWQRYHEPFLILLLGILAAYQPTELRGTLFARCRIPGMLALVALLSGITYQSFTEAPVKPGTLPPAIHTSPDDPWAGRVLDQQPG